MFKKIITVLLLTNSILAVSCDSLKNHGKGMDTDIFLEQYREIPKELKDKTRVAFLGEYWRGRSPCVIRGDKRVWFLTAGFEVQQDFIGNIKVKSIGIDPSVELIRGATYIVLLNPAKNTMEIIQTGNEIFSYFEAVSEEEVIKIFETR